MQTNTVGRTKVIVYQREEKEQKFNGVVSISPSSLRRSCPYFQTLAALKVPPQREPSKDFLIGRNYHEKIEQFLATEDPTYLEGFPKATVGPLKKVLLRLRAMAGGGILEIERGLKKEYNDPPIVVRGYMDIFLRNPGYPAYISDAKSFDRVEEIKPEEKRQLLFYIGLVAVSEEVPKAEKGRILSSVLRIKAGKLVAGPEKTLDEAKRYYNEELLPLARETGRKIHTWIKEYKEGTEPPAVPGPQCKACPYIFTCPLLRRVPKNESEVAAQFVVIDTLHAYIREALRGKTIILPEAVIYPKVSEWKTLPGKNLAHILNLINSLQDKYQRASFLEKIAQLSSGISSYKVEHAHRLTANLIELLIAQKKEELREAKTEDEWKRLKREIENLEKFSFEALKETNSRVSTAITTPEKYEKEVKEDEGAN